MYTHVMSCIAMYYHVLQVWKLIVHSSKRSDASKASTNQTHVHAVKKNFSTRFYKFVLLLRMQALALLKMAVNTLPFFKFISYKKLSCIKRFSAKLTIQFGVEH